MNFKSHWYILASQPFRWFILNCTFAAFGNGLAYIAMSWIVLQHDNSVGAVAMLMLCFWIPMIILGPLCGVIADRYNKKVLLIIANISRAFLLISVAGIAGSGLTAEEAYLRAFLIGTFFALYNPAAFALLRQVVPKQQLLSANSLMDMAYEIGNVVGMSSAGLFLALLSAQSAIAFNGVLFLLAGLCLLRIKMPSTITTDEPPKPKRHFWRDWHDGFNYLRERRSVTALYLAQLLMAVNFITSPVLLAPFAKNILHTNVMQFGFLEACISAGIVIGNLLAPIMVDLWRVKNVLFVETISLLVFYIWFSLNSSISLAYGLYFLIGIGLAAWPLAISKAQELTDMAYQGRVQATFNSVMSILVISIYLSLYWSGNAVPLRALYVLEATIALATVWLLWGQRKIL
jgi:MFS family permease